MSDDGRSGGGAPQRAIVGPAPGYTSAARPARATHRGFASSISWTFAGTLLPGVGLIRAGRRRLGTLVLVTFLTSLAAVALLSASGSGRNLLLSLAVRPAVLNVVWVGLLILGAVWVGTLVLTHLSLRPRHPTEAQRLVGAFLVGALSLAVALPTFVGARHVYETATLLTEVFTGGDEPVLPGASPRPTFGNQLDPWAAKPRLNVLILGGDSGQSRAERLGARTDTVILASIDTRTGETVLFSIPRQTLRMPFPEGSELDDLYPSGYPDLLNSMYNNIPEVAPDAIPPARNPGAEVVKIAVGEALGLEVDYYAMVDMDGFIEFINALGGITVNINKPVAVGGVTSDNIPPDRWLPPGPDQHLNGVDALWFARGRYGTTDYERMSRQRCVIRAVVKQVQPATVLANYEALSKAGKNIVLTDVPNTVLPAFLDLALRMQGQPMRSLSLENGKDGFSTEYPDWDLVRDMVEDTLRTPTPTPSASLAPSASATPTEKPTATPSASSSTSPTPSEEPTYATVEDECAYHPEPLIEE